MTTQNTKINRKDLFKNIAIVVLSMLSLLLTFVIVFSKPADAAELVVPMPEVQYVEKVKVIYVSGRCNHDVNIDETEEDEVITNDTPIVSDDEIIDVDDVYDLDAGDTFDEFETDNVESSNTIVDTNIENNVEEESVFEPIEPPVIIVPDITEDKIETETDIVIEPNDNDEVEDGMVDTEDDKSDVTTDVVEDVETDVEIFDELIEDEKEIVVIIPEIPAIQEPAKPYATTKFVTTNGDIIIEYDGENQELIDAVIHDILYFMINVEFNWNGEYATLTITGEDVWFYADRVEVNGVRIATLYGAEAFMKDNLFVIAMYTEFAN